MTSFGNKYGRKSVTWKVSTAGRKYFKLEDLAAQYAPDKRYIIDCMFINTKSQYGDAPVVGVADVKEPYMVNLPKHLLNEVRDMISDVEAIEAIQLGRAGFTIRIYNPKGSNRVCYTVDWVDIDQPGDLPF